MMNSESAVISSNKNPGILQPGADELPIHEKNTEPLLSISRKMAMVADKAKLSIAIRGIFIHTTQIKKYYVSIFDQERTSLNTYLFDFGPGFVNLPQLETLLSVKSLKDGIIDRIMRSAGPLQFDTDRLVRSGQAPSYVQLWKQTGLKKVIASNLIYGGEPMGIIWIEPHLMNIKLTEALCIPVAAAISNILAKQKIQTQTQEIFNLKQNLENENLHPPAQMQSMTNYGEIVGSSESMRAVYQLVSKVAKTQSTVLIMGETGTGKELIARAVHKASIRKEKTMIKINCAALPPNLIESELFGHERGSFTGATERRIGKFELANKSTLFLDEVGELPLELQAKLLRALQEKEIERVGGQAVIKIDVRIIAATNRNLMLEVQKGNFRSDLYFRLNIFPIVMPPLRTRKEDIADLANYFLHKYAPRSLKKLPAFSSKVLKQLTAYSWPGNVRELEHLIERSIVLTPGAVINQINLPDISEDGAARGNVGSHIKTIDEVEREHIIAVLKYCNGKVAGIGGAAEVLKIPSTTLNSKIRRLNIKKEHRLK